MNSKLRNTALALASTSAFLMLAMLSSSPALPTQPAGATAINPAALSRGLDVGSAIAFEDTSAGIASNAIASEATTRPTWKSKRLRRQTLVMPFFSFAPRG